MKLNEVYLVNYNFTDEKKGDPAWQERFGHIAVLSEDSPILEGCGDDLEGFNKLVKKELGVSDDDIVFYISFPAEPTVSAFKRAMKKEGFIIHSIAED